jgi:hypothetical protein
MYISHPLNAATLSGMLMACNGSTSPRIGLRERLENPTFALRGSYSKTAVPVVSLPVPLVVGTEKKIDLKVSSHGQKP